MKQFSFLIPVYNAEPYLDTLLCSILRQEAENYEIILLNDGSTDNSLSVCNAFAAKYPDLIRVITRENCGAVQTRRELFEAASGEWIWIIDSDDYLENGAIKELNSIIDRESCDMILFDNFSLDVSPTDVSHQLEHMDYTVFEGEEKIALYRLFINTSKLNPLWNKVFKRECIDFEEDYSMYKHVRRANDKLQTFPILLNARKIVYLPKPLYYYRYVEGSLANVFKNYTCESITTVNKRCEQLVERYGLTDVLSEDMLNHRCRLACELTHGYICSENMRPTLKDYKAFYQSLISDEFYRTAILNGRCSSTIYKVTRLFLRLHMPTFSYYYAKICRRAIRFIHRRK